ARDSLPEPINEVPWWLAQARAGTQVLIILLADDVRPCRGAHEELALSLCQWAGVVREEVEQARVRRRRCQERDCLRACCRRHVVPGDAGDELVASAVPGEHGLRQAADEEEREEPTGACHDVVPFLAVADRTIR